MKKLIQKLTDTYSPSGYEEAIRDVILAEIKELAEDIRVDALGNIIAKKGKHGKRVMVAAHMDEIGLIATHIDESGFVYFTSVGGSNPRYLPGGHVRFVNGVLGVIGSERISKANVVQPIDKLFVDVGATSAAECPVQVGDMAAFVHPNVQMGGRLVAKSLDDRIGVAVAIETMRRLKSGPNEVFFVFSVQEELGTRGAIVSAYGIDPEIGIGLDVSHTGDTPNSIRRELALGAGPAIMVKDSRMLYDPKVVAWMEGTAKKAKIPVQREVLVGGSTDARAIQVTRLGVPTGGLAIPCRYIHSPSEMIDYEDVENAVKLLTALLSAPIEL
ncbi:MAG: M42 family metallopeptidase [Anaerolineae bacterium]|nr:M42 family metallopeptidase [Anaerolineae bacterium]